MNRETLRLIAGGLDYSCSIGTTRIGVVPLEAPAPEVDAVVLEQDTHALLAVDSQIVTSGEALTTLTEQLTAFKPFRVGGVVVKPARPLQLFAIVHDLDLAPSWRETWIVSALEATLRVARARRLRRLGMAALGTVHGQLPLERFIELLVETVASHPEGPAVIWLGVESHQCPQAVAALRHHCTTHQPL